MEKLKVLSLFDGMSCGRLALEQLGFKDEVIEYYASEIKPHGIKVSKENFPNIIQIGDVTKVSFKDGILVTENGEFNVGEFDMVIGGSPCFVAGTKVITNNGYKNIEDIVVGDMVLTHENRYKKVLATGSDFKNIFKLKAQGISTTETTSNHPYYVREKTVVNGKRVFSEPKWKEVKDLTKSDFVGLPINNTEINTYNLTEEDCWLLGRYVADGHYRDDKRKGRITSKHHQVIYSVGNAKLDEFKEKVTDHHFSCYPHSQSVHRCVISSKELVEFIIEQGFGKGAVNKRIPQCILDLPVNLAKKFLEGYVSGDGYSQPDRIKVSSISKELIMGLNLLIAKCYNVNSSFHEHKVEPTTVIEGRTVNQNDTYISEFRFEMKKQSNATVIGDFIWLPIKEVVNTNESKVVFNIEVEDDNSYTANNAVVHNCQNFSAACIKEKRLGLEGEKSKLFYEYLRILKEVNPKYFLLENVASMSKDSKRQLDEYMEVEGIKINSQYLTPASRNRLYWTNFKTTELEDIRTDSLNDILTEGFAKKELSTCLMEGHSRPNVDPLRLTRRHLETGFIPIVYQSQEHYEELIKHYNEHYKGLNAKEVDAIRKGIDNSVYNGVRVLNSIEMERLQGVKEGYTSCVSRNEAASLLGDGWTVPVISHLMNELKDTYSDLL